MLEVLSNWCFIFLSSIILGYGFLQGVWKNCRGSKCFPDMAFVGGIMVINWYAEFFSIFARVGAEACAVLFLADILGIISFLRGGLIRPGQLRRCVAKISVVQWIISIICILTTALWTVKSPEHYDTCLYHAQAIRWIEEYGVVAGLGNLHNRLAYNSAFMPLQALFSMRWLGGQSLHAVNGFLCCMAMVYALTTNHAVKREALQLSDWFKMAVVIYIWMNREIISSPSSDWLPMLLILYICIKWSEFTELNIRRVEPYAFVSMVGIWAVTVKLSTVSCLFLILYPLIRLLKEKRWNDVWCIIFQGTALVFPWIVRNILISGYLLYPYAQFDFFDVDWKMPASVLECDSMEIMVWGRGLKDISSYHIPFTGWFPEWFFAQTVHDRCLIVLGGMAVLNVIILVLADLVRKKHLSLNILRIFSLVGLATWIFTSPLMRYGQVYLLIPICIMLSCLFEKVTIRKGNTVVFPLLMLVTGNYFLIWSTLDYNSLFCQEDYAYRETRGADLMGVQIHLPTESDQCGYYGFPGTPYPKILELIELRGDGVEDGFRAREIYHQRRLNNSGQEW